jgi:NPCBM/NEW2 domain-containing protein
MIFAVAMTFIDQLPDYWVEGVSGHRAGWAGCRRWWVSAWRWGAVAGCAAAGSSGHADKPSAGAQVLDLIVGDAGDGNGNDHGDWAIPTLTCT